MKTEKKRILKMRCKSLKSTSLTIGVVHLSEGEKALEMAAKAGDVDYIRSHHKEVLEEYIELTDRLKEILEVGKGIL